jgi:hypothetical protein
VVLFSILVAPIFQYDIAQLALLIAPTAAQNEDWGINTLEEIYQEPEMRAGGLVTELSR